jgi:glycosyltransferase involved in cell wall biosynthesis
VSLKIVQIIPTLDAGGAERTVVEITRAVVDAGGAAMTITAGGHLEEEVLAAGGEIAHLPVASKNPYIMWRNAGRIARLANGFGANLIHARSRAPAFSALSAARQLGLPFVTTYHGTYSAKGALKRRYNAIMVSGDRVIANSDFIARHIISEHGVDARRITVIARGVAPEYFNIQENLMPSEQALSALKLSFRAPFSSPLIVLPGRLTRLKGHALALEALALLHKENCPAHIIIAGSFEGRADYKGEVSALVSALNLQGYVHFSGHVTDMATLYACADMVLTASIQPEAFGRVAAEAQASARLAIAPAHGGSLDIIEDSKTGLLFQPGKASDLAQVLQKALALPKDARRKICIAGRKHAHEHYSQSQMCVKTLGVYHELLKPSKGH